MAVRILLLFLVLNLSVLLDPLELLPRPYVVEEGEPVLGLNSSLRCVVLSLPSDVSFDQLTFTWFKDSQELEGQSQDRLHFDPVNRSDAGAYTCRISDGNPLITSPESKPHHLYVLVRPKVSIEPKNSMSETRGILGSNLTLTCIVKDAIPRVLDDGYTWSYLPYGKSEWSILPEKEHSLKLGHVTLEVRGDYRCQARNDKGLQGPIPPGEDTVSVQAVYLENITLTPDLEVNEGDPVTLTCSVDSYLPARLTWIVDGQEVRHVTYNVDHYVLERAACSDNKTYTCRASNSDLPGLERHASTRLTVNCSEEDTPDEVTTPSSGGNGVEVSATFQVETGNVSEVHIQHPSGRPVVRLLSNGSFEVMEEFRHRVTNLACDMAHKQLSFTLIKVTVEDEGEYTCKNGGNGGRELPICSWKLLLKGCESQVSTVVALGVIVSLPITVLVSACVYFFCRRFYRRKKSSKHVEMDRRPPGETKGEEAGEIESLAAKTSSEVAEHCSDAAEEKTEADVGAHEAGMAVLLAANTSPGRAGYYSGMPDIHSAEQ